MSKTLKFLKRVMENNKEEKETPEQTREDLEIPEETPEGENPEGEEPEKSEPEKTENKSDEIQRRDAQIAHWREKSEKLEKQIKESPKKETPKTESEWKDKVDFLLKNKKYSEKEFDHIASVAKGKGISLSESAESEKDYITYQREKVAKESKIPEPSTKQSIFKKPIDKITPKEVRAMTVKEKEEYLNKLGWGKK